MDSMEDVIYLPDGHPLYPDFATRNAVGRLRPEDVAYLVIEPPGMGLESALGSDPDTITDKVLITRIIRALQNAYTGEPTFTDPYTLETLEYSLRRPTSRGVWRRSGSMHGPRRASAPSPNLSRIN
jgi:hypothetical protein